MVPKHHLVGSYNIRGCLVGQCIVGEPTIRNVVRGRWLRKDAENSQYYFENFLGGIAYLKIPFQFSLARSNKNVDIMHSDHLVTLVMS